MKKESLVAGSVVAILVFLTFGANAQVTVGYLNMSDFRLVQKQNEVMIKWIADGTTENNYYEVEKSVDGKNFKTVAYVLGPDPLQKDCFRCLDKIITKPKQAYYRVKRVGENGDIQYSETKTLALR